MLLDVKINANGTKTYSIVDSWGIFHKTNSYRKAHQIIADCREN